MSCSCKRRARGRKARVWLAGCRGSGASIAMLAFWRLTEISDKEIEYLTVSRGCPAGGAGYGQL
eukprot:5751629-Pyramimonas_sp.AAC.1